MLEIRNDVRGRRWLAAGAVVVTMTLAAAACGSSASKSAVGANGTSATNVKSRGAPYKIGFDDALTGKLATYGASFQAGAVAAAKAVNASGDLNGHELQLVAADDQSDPSLAHSNVLTLANQGVLAVAGFISSQSASAAAPASLQAGLPVMTVTYTDQTADPTRTGKYMFDTDQDPLGGEVRAAFALGGKLVSGPKRLAILYQTLSTQDAATEAKATDIAKSMGWQIVSKIAYDPTATSWDAEDSQLVSSKPNIVLSLLVSPALNSVVNSLRVAGITVPVIVNKAVGAATFSTINDADVYGASAWHLLADSAVQGVAAMRAAASAAGEDVNGTFFETGYVQIEMLAQALKQCAGPCSRDGLLSALNNLDGNTLDGLLLGPTSYSPSNHFGVTATGYYHWANGQLVLVQA